MSLMRSLDRLEQAILLIGGGFLLHRLWPGDFGYASFYLLLILFSEGLSVFFTLARRNAAAISVRFRDWLIAIIGSAGPLFVGTGGAPIAYDIGIVLLFAGIFVHLGAKLSLRRSFGIVAANRGLRVNGVYKIVRHPMYTGYMMTHFGFWLTAPSLRNALIYAVVWSAFFARMLAEEKLLSEDAAYRDYKQRVRWRIIPAIY